MFCDYGIELCSNLREVPVQIKRLHADLVSTHLVTVIRLNGLIRCCIKKHTGNCVWLVAELRILVFDVGENLIQITGVKRMDIVLSLCGMRLRLCINYKYLATFCEHDITLHYRQQNSNAIVQSP